MNTNLTAAKTAKNDEFYTQYADVEREVMAYLDFDPDVFAGKTVLLPCDDPEWSNFTRFFAQKFTALGIKKLISTSYNREGGQGKVFTLTQGEGRTDFRDLKWEWLEGDGDFRSDEACALLEECDIVVTNPPFSLFREFLAQIVAADKKFLLIGNMNAITYKEAFPLIKDNKMWLGTSAPKEFRDGDHRDAAPLKKFGNICWFTNIDHGRRHEHLILMTMKDNLRYNKKFAGMKKYQRYDNYDAIEVPQTKAIPSDYDGVMGVPITFLDKYNPEQFEIVRFRHGYDDKDLAIDGRTPYFRILIRHINPTK